MWNNKYVMYYMATNGGNEFIGLAYSENGTHWERYCDDPVLNPCTLANDPGAGWDYYSVGYCSVMNISGSWHMLYSGGPGTNHGIGYATSPDGISWTKHSDNPIFHKDDGEDWRNSRTYTPWVLYDSANFSGHGDACPYKMWFSGRSADGKYSIGYACATPIVVDAGPNQTITSGGSTAIGGSPTASSGTPPYTYNWTPAIGLNNHTLSNPVASPTTTTNYTVTVTDSKGCTGSDNMTVYVQPPSPPTPPISGGGLPASYAACPVTLAAYMQGNITTVKMTKDGVLCDTCLAKDATEEYTLEIDKDAKVMLANNTVPLVLKFRESPTTPPTPENTVIVGPVYELNAYSSTFETTPSPITISPPARLILTYDPDKLPQNTTEIFIANYNSEQGWLALAPVPGVVAEIGKAHGLASHFSPFAVLARLEELAPAKFETTNLTIEPAQAQPNQEITISLTVANTGEKSGDYILEMKVDGAVKATKQVTLTPGTSSSENFNLNLTTPGKHYLEIGGLTGQIEILPQATSNTKWRPLAIVVFIILVLLSIIVLTLIIKRLISA